MGQSKMILIAIFLMQFVNMILLILRLEIEKQKDPQLSGRLVWTYELFKVYGWIPGQNYTKTN